MNPKLPLEKRVGDWRVFCFHSYLLFLETGSQLLGSFLSVTWVQGNVCEICLPVVPGPGSCWAPCHLLGSERRLSVFAHLFLWSTSRDAFLRLSNHPSEQANTIFFVVPKNGFWLKPRCPIINGWARPSEWEEQAPCCRGAGVRTGRLWTSWHAVFRMKPPLGRVFPLTLCTDCSNQGVDTSSCSGWLGRHRGYQCWVSAPCVLLCLPFISL